MNKKKKQDEEKDQRTKTIREFDQSMACNITCLTKEKNNEVKPTTRFFNKKLLMFSKLFLISFIYNLLETFCFPNKSK